MGKRADEDAGQMAWGSGAHIDPNVLTVGQVCPKTGLQRRNLSYLVTMILTTALIGCLPSKSKT